MDLWSWGANTRGQLGHGFASEQISRPTCVRDSKITNLLASLPKSADGETTRPAIKIDGGGTQTLVCIGRTLIKIGRPYNNLNSTVKGKQKDNCDVVERDAYEPCIISQDLCINEIACGWDFNLILTSDNKVYSWGGDNKYGQLGRELLSSNIVNSNEFEEIPELLAVKIAAGLRRAAAVGIDGHLYVWGDNSKSDLGVGNSIEKIVQRPTKVILDTNIVDVKCGKSFTIALDNKGQFWGCGDNRFGQLGLGNSGGDGGNVSTFTKLSFWTDQQGQVAVKQFECGWNHVLILLDNGQVLAFGRNNFGQLGRSVDSSASNIVPGIPEKIASIAIGSEHNLALSQSGTVYCWGWNEHESCGVESSNVSDSANTNQIRDSVISATVLKFPGEAGKIFLIGCGAGNGFAVSSSVT